MVDYIAQRTQDLTLIPRQMMSSTNQPLAPTV